MKNIIKNLSKLIKNEEKTREKRKTFHPYNNSIESIKYKNNENDNTIFIINRYTNNHFINDKNIYNNEAKLKKNRNTININSTLYKDDTTTNSTLINPNLSLMYIKFI